MAPSSDVSRLLLRFVLFASVLQSAIPVHLSEVSLMRVALSDDQIIHSRHARQVISNPQMFPAPYGAALNIPIPTNIGYFPETGGAQGTKVCARDKVEMEDGTCQILLTQGNCTELEEVILDPDTNKGICVPRLCPPDRVFVHNTQKCHDPTEIGICPPGRELYYSSYGTPVCSCPDGTIEGDDDLDDDVCELILGESLSCPPGQVFWFRNYNSPPECLPDPCNGQNLNRNLNELPYIPSESTGECLQLGKSMGVCPQDMWYSLGLTTLKGKCATLEEAGYTVFDQDTLDLLRRTFGPPVTESRTKAVSPNNQNFGQGQNNFGQGQNNFEQGQNNINNRPNDRFNTNMNNQNQNFNQGNQGINPNSNNFNQGNKFGQNEGGKQSVGKRPLGYNIKNQQTGQNLQGLNGNFGGNQPFKGNNGLNQGNFGGLPDQGNHFGNNQGNTANFGNNQGNSGNFGNNQGNNGNFQGQNIPNNQSPGQAISGNDFNNQNPINGNRPNGFSQGSQAGQGSQGSFGGSIGQGQQTQGTGQNQGDNFSSNQGFVNNQQGNNINDQSNFIQGQGNGQQQFPSNSGFQGQGQSQVSNNSGFNGQSLGQGPQQAQGHGQSQFPNNSGIQGQGQQGQNQGQQGQNQGQQGQNQGQQGQNQGQQGQNQGQQGQNQGQQGQNQGQMQSIEVFGPFQGNHQGQGGYLPPQQGQNQGQFNSPEIFGQGQSSQSNSGSQSQFNSPEILGPDGLPFNSPEVMGGPGVVSVELTDDRPVGHRRNYFSLARRINRSFGVQEPTLPADIKSHYTILPNGQVVQHRTRRVRSTNDSPDKDFSSLVLSYANNDRSSHSHIRKKRDLLFHASPSNVFHTRLLGCRPGQARDINGKCRTTILPQYIPKRRGTRAAPPIGPTPSCPNGMAFNIRRQCVPVSTAQNSILAYNLG